MVAGFAVSTEGEYSAPTQIDRIVIMSKAGFVYVMVSSSRDRLIKIGGTQNHPNERARALNSTGVPFDWVVSYYEQVSDWELVEKLLHAHFESCRTNQNREFFCVEPREAIERLQQFAILYPAGDQSSTPTLDVDTTDSMSELSFRNNELDRFYAAVEEQRRRRQSDKPLWTHVQCRYCTCRYSARSEEAAIARCPVCQRQNQV